MNKLETVKAAIEWARANPKAYAEFIERRKAESEEDARLDEEARAEEEKERAEAEQSQTKEQSQATEKGEQEPSEPPQQQTGEQTGENPKAQERARGEPQKGEEAWYGAGVKDADGNPIDLSGVEVEDVGEVEVAQFPE